MHNLTDPYNDFTRISKTQAREYIEISNEVEQFFESVEDEDMLGVCRLKEQNMPPEFRMKHLDIWQKKLERWTKIVSYYKRQSVYDYYAQTGHGAGAQSGRILEVTRQRCHDMFKEAEAERLSKFQPSSYCEDARQI